MRDKEKMGKRVKRRKVDEKMIINRSNNLLKI